ncbi:MAG: hypothetical protein IJD08_07035 [Oscillospiraceae bacterium]|nr:hypothetical protein [Oscillospiraceae bacterium]
MKKILTILLAAIMVLSFAGCGTETEVPAEEITEPMEEIVPEEVFYSLGDTVKTESIEFTLDEFDFHKCLSNVGDADYMNPLEEGDTWYNSKNPYYADDEHIMVRISFTYKNIGKTSIETLPDYIFCLEYSDGYTFDEFGVQTKNADGDYSFIWDIEPLSDALNGRGAVKVPIVVMENTEEPIVLIIKLGGQEFKYKIR